MTGGYQALTEKEKQTLRLLLGGHDAKSIARHLGLSVHTIHERLRDARRKLGTPSSREAARLLRDIEGQTPESFGDSVMGDATATSPAQPVRRPARYGNWRRARWLIGGCAMTMTLALLVLFAPSGPGEAPAIQTTTVGAATAIAPTPASEAAAVDAARQFLTMLDRDDWRASWQATHTSFQLLNTAEWWAKSSQAVRVEVGTATARELEKVAFTAAPPKGYWVVTFKTRYSKKGSATETVQMASDGATWKVAGIMID